jgi:glycosyltransferase involved in cell wall biosynthesis
MRRVERANPDVVLIDLCAWSGHHKNYFLHVTHALMERGLRVAGLCLDPYDYELSFEREYSLKDTPQIVELDFSMLAQICCRVIGALTFTIEKITGKPLIVYPYHVENLFKVKDSLRKARIRRDVLVFFLHLDSMLLVQPTFLGKILMPARWIGLYFLPSYRMSVDHNLYVGAIRRERILGSTKCKGLFLLDDGPVKYFGSRVKHGFVEWLPEVLTTEKVESEEIPPELKEIVGKQKIVGLFGPLYKRKNVLNLLRAFERLGRDDFYLVLMGELTLDEYSSSEGAELHALIGKLGNLLCDFGFIPGEDRFNSLLAASDIVSVTYRDFVGSSNVLVKAAYFRKPVIASSGYAIAEQVEKYHLGCVVDQDDVGGLSEAIEYLGDEFVYDEAKLEDYLSRFSRENFIGKMELVRKECSPALESSACSK